MLAHERVAEVLLSADARYAALEVAVGVGQELSPDQILQLSKDVRAIVADLVADLPVRAHYTGTLALNEAYVQVVRHDLRLFLPGLLVLFSAALYALLGSAPLAGYILLHAAMAVVGAFGLAGWLGLELAALHAFVPVMITSISVAGAVHLATSHLRHRGRGSPVEERVVHALGSNLLPLTLASATTVLGFLGLATSPSPPVRVLGYLVATGVTLAWLLSLTVYPRLLRRVSTGRVPGFALTGLADWVARRRGSILAAGIAIALLAGAGLARSEIRDNVFEYFPAASPFRQATALAETHLSGVNALLYSIDAGEAFGLFDARILAETDAFAEWLQGREEVRRVLAVTDLRPLTDRLAGDDAEAWLGTLRRRAETEGGRPAYLAQEVSPDLSASRVLVLLEELDSRDLLAFDRSVRDWLARSLVASDVEGGVGASLLLAAVSDRNARGMLLSLSAALVAIALALGLVLRSVRVVWVGLVCNLLPVAAIYGLWAAAGGAISIGAACVMGMILGIVVDDTIYLLSRYARLRRAGDPTPVAGALIHVGPALVVTTIVLGVGLALGLLSSFQPIVVISLLSAAIIAVALATDLFLLPALLDPAGES